MIGIAFPILIFHIIKAPAKDNAIKLILIIGLLGFIFDSSFNYFHLIDYKNHGVVPFWIVILWALFASTLNLSMRWLRSNLILSTVFGCIGGPLSYLAGEKLNAIHIANDASLIILGFGWAFAVPFCFELAKRWDGYPAIPRSNQP